jgi:cytochrome P450
VYKGKFIPRGTVVVLNTWTLHHDEGRFEDLHEFRPERYLGDTLSSAQSANGEDPGRKDLWVFGVG